MVSTIHEAIRDVFRDDPMICVELLAKVGVIDRSSVREAQCADPTVPQNVAPSLAADAVVVLRGDRGPIFVAVIEVQLEIAPDKLWTWPMYATALRREHQCPVAVVAVCPRPDVGQWARATVEIGPSHRFAAITLSAAEIPSITDRAIACLRPRLSVLSAIAHGNKREGGIDVVLAALSAIHTLDEAHTRVYTAAIWEALDSAAKSALEKAMSVIDPAEETEFERWRREIWEAKWRRALEAEGRSEAEAKGRVEGEADALRTVLAARGFTIDSATESRIASCHDLATLRRWIAKAATATVIDTVFAE
ncbi:MAG: hypothetical protein JNK05_34725 [Myxococcales bacterium]|nr:hypothetical protein [Myxococcales bacterium]